MGCARECVCRLVLEASYEATLYAAALAAHRRLGSYMYIKWFKMQVIKSY